METLCSKKKTKKSSMEFENAECSSVYMFSLCVDKLFFFTKVALVCSVGLVLYDLKWRSFLVFVRLWASYDEPWSRNFSFSWVFFYFCVCSRPIFRKLVHDSFSFAWCPFSIVKFERGVFVRCYWWFQCLASRLTICVPRYLSRLDPTRIFTDVSMIVCCLYSDEWI